MKQSNPKGFRLGLSQNWNINISHYSNDFKLYSNLLNTNEKIKRYTIKLLKQNNLTGDIFEWIIYPKFWKLTLYYFNSKTKFKLFNLLNKVHFILIKWTKLPLIINFYGQKLWTNTSYLLIEYIKFSVKKQNFKYVFKNLQTKLLQQINKKIICYNMYGPKSLKLTGIKICCKGRLGSYRNPLSQTFKKSIGSLPLLKLNSYVDYSQHCIYTKRGSYGIQIWIFYS